MFALPWLACLFPSIFTFRFGEALFSWLKECSSDFFSPKDMRLPSPEGLLELGEGNRMGFSVSAWG